jgi:hypothetical protein
MMKIVHSQPRQFAETGISPETRLCFPALALCGALLVIGCTDRRTTNADPDATPAPTTTPPVGTPPTTATTPVQEAATRGEQPDSPDRVAEEDTRVLDPPEMPTGRTDEEESSTPLEREPAVGQKDVQRSDDERTPAQTGVEEEDVSAALRREAAEIERRRARQ